MPLSVSCTLTERPSPLLVDCIHHLFATSSSPLEPTSRPQYRDALIHNPFAYPEVAIHPFFQFFAIGDLVLLDAGAEIPILGP